MGTNLFETLENDCKSVNDDMEKTKYIVCVCVCFSRGYPNLL